MMWIPRRALATWSLSEESSGGVLWCKTRRPADFFPVAFAAARVNFAPWQAARGGRWE
jgi:hypothetical protein